MSPLVVTVILIFAAGVVGFFFGCLFARWLNDAPELNDGSKLPFKMDLALITATPTGSDPSTSIMLYKPEGTAPGAVTVAPPSSAVAAAAALAEKTAAPVQSEDRPSEPMPSTQVPIAALAPPPVMAEKKAQSQSAVSTSSTAAGSANPSVTPLRGPLAVARATSKSGDRDKKKTAKTPRRRKSDKKPQARKAPKSDISIAASKSKPASKAKTAGTAKKPAKTTVNKPAATIPGETRAKKPRFMPKPRKAGPDDLKRIKGVGPALETTLNKLGVFHYNQISKWTPENVMWVDDHLKFKGRIARDNWLDQAAKLEAGEVTEFAARVDKGAVASSKGKPRRTKS